MNREVRVLADLPFRCSGVCLFAAGDTGICFDVDHSPTGARVCVCPGFVDGSLAAGAEFVFLFECAFACARDRNEICHELNFADGCSAFVAEVCIVFEFFAACRAVVPGGATVRGCVIHGTQVRCLSAWLWWDVRSDVSRMTAPGTTI